jgi:translation initiation factor IF-3
MINNKKFQKELENNINEGIKASEVRLVDAEQYGCPNGLYSLEEAIKIASKAELDLIEVSLNISPAICRIMNYSKFKYEKKKKEKESKKNQKGGVVKEIRLTPNIGANDLETKIKQSKEFLEKGNKIKATIFFSGREIIHKQNGEVTILQFVQSLSDFGVPEDLPKLEGKRMFVSIRPKK